MRVVIFGSREFGHRQRDGMSEEELSAAYEKNEEDYELLVRKVKESNAFKNNLITAIVCGEAHGADTLGRRFAEDNHINVISMPADWKKYGKRAGYIRNVEMANCADAAIGFWDGESKGTQNMITICEIKRLPMRIIRYKETNA